MVVRSELVVCCATLRLSDCAPDSLNAFWVTLEIWKRPNGVIVADAGAHDGSSHSPRIAEAMSLSLYLKGQRAGVATAQDCARRQGCCAHRSTSAPYQVMRSPAVSAWLESWPAILPS